MRFLQKDNGVRGKGGKSAEPVMNHAVAMKR
jgi:hypothetical protein